MVFPGQSLIPPVVDHQVQSVVIEALLEGKQLEVQYRKKNETGTVRYRIHPLAMVSRGAVIYLYARIFDDRDARNLAMHRIIEARRLDACAVPPEDYDLDDSIEKGIWAFGSGNTLKVLLRFVGGKGDHLKESPLSIDQRIEEQGQDGCITVRATVADTPQLRWWILGGWEPESRFSSLSRCDKMCRRELPE